MTDHPLGPVSRYLGRDHGNPSAADLAAAGMALTEPGGAVIKGNCFVGLHSEFGITGQAYNKATGRIRRGRFLVQWTDLDGEVLHHTYKATT